MAPLEPVVRNTPRQSRSGSRGRACGRRHLPHQTAPGGFEPAATGLRGRHARRYTTEPRSRPEGRHAPGRSRTATARKREGYSLLGSPLPGRRREESGRRRARTARPAQRASARLAAGAGRRRPVHLPVKDRGGARTRISRGCNAVPDRFGDPAGLLEQHRPEESNLHRLGLEPSALPVELDRQGTQAAGVEPAPPGSESARLHHA